jgi:hypothetical protein
MNLLLKITLIVAIIIQSHKTYGNYFELVLDSTKCSYSIHEKGEGIPLYMRLFVQTPTLNSIKKEEYIKELLTFRQLDVKSTFSPTINFSTSSNSNNYSFSINVNMEAIVLINAILLNHNPLSQEYLHIFHGYRIFNINSKKWHSEDKKIIELLFDWYEINYKALLSKTQLNQEDFRIENLEWN